MAFIIFAILVPIILIITTYNKFIKYRNRMQETWSGIDVALKRRFNLIPNLVKAVRMYSQHEAETLENVTHQRVGAEEPVKRTEEESVISQSLQRLLAVAESYPDLKASHNYLDLQKSLSEVEKEIQTARLLYNSAVRKNNVLVESFPSNLIAKIFKFKTAEYFSLELATQRAVPDIS